MLESSRDSKAHQPAVRSKQGPEGGKLAGSKSEHLRGHCRPQGLRKMQKSRRSEASLGLIPMQKETRGHLLQPNQKPRPIEGKRDGHVFPGLCGPRTCRYPDQSWCRSFSSCTRRCISVMFPALPILPQRSIRKCPRRPGNKDK